MYSFRFLVTMVLRVVPSRMSLTLTSSYSSLVMSALTNMGMDIVYHFLGLYNNMCIFKTFGNRRLLGKQRQLYRRDQSFACRALVPRLGKASC